MGTWGSRTQPHAWSSPPGPANGQELERWEHGGNGWGGGRGRREENTTEEIQEGSEGRKGARCYSPHITGMSGIGQARETESRVGAVVGKG